MIITKMLSGTIKGLGKFFNSNTGKKTLFAGSALGVGLAGNGVVQSVHAKNKNKKAIIIKNEALLKYDDKLTETHTYISKLVLEEKKSINLIEHFMNLTRMINKCPSMPDLNVIDIKVPEVTFDDIKELSNGLDLAISGIGGAVAGSLPAVIFYGASIGTLSLGALGGGVALSIKGSKLSKQATNNVRQAKKMSKDVESIIKYFTAIDIAVNELTSTTAMANKLFKKKLAVLKKVVDTNNNYESYTKKEKTLVKNMFKLTILVIQICRTKLAKRVDESEQVNTEELNFIIEKSKKVFNEIKQPFYA